MDLNYKDIHIFIQQGLFNKAKAFLLFHLAPVQNQAYKIAPVLRLKNFWQPSQVRILYVVLYRLPGGCIVAFAIE